MVKFQCESVSIEYIIVGCGSKVRNTCVLSQDKVCIMLSKALRAV
jgi:hypothetical protein